MIIDARSLSPGHLITADICIIGGGAAGLTLANQLAGHRLQVVTIESGGRWPCHTTQQLYGGALSGHAYYPLDACRFRMLGGSTSQWGGWCRPLDDIDFEARDWIPDSGWPFPKQELDGSYRRAHDVCGLGAYDYEASPSTPDDSSGLVQREQEDFRDTIFRVRPTRFGDTYSTAARGSTASLVLNANVLEITMDRTGRTATKARAATLRGNHLSIRAGVFILAGGGIENARILLCSRHGGNRGLGNDNDLVGRYFSDHLHVPIGVIRPRTGEAEFYRLHERSGVAVRGVISLTEACRRRVRGLGFAVTLHDTGDPHDVLSLAQTKQSYRSLQTLARAVRRGRRPDRLLHHLRNVIVKMPEAGWLAYRRYVKRPARTLLVGCRAEQTPNADSRVTLDDRCDQFGTPRIRLDWRVSEQDLESLRRAQHMLAGALRHESLDMFPFRTTTGGGWESAIAGGAHHMGTTRMHRDPKYGVVDGDCRVHGTTNVYIAGSSVFPTGGWAPPTLTIVALALRLADHLTDGGSRSEP